MNFDQLKLSFDRSKNRFNRSSTNRARQIQTKILIAILIGWEIASIDWKSRKVTVLKNNENFMQKPLKPTYFMNQMHEYEFKSFQKHMNSTQIFQKQGFQHFCPQKHILHQNQGTYNLRWPKQIHTQYHVLNLAKNNLYSVCN